MNRYFFALAAILHFFVSYGQLDTTYNETFDKNNNTWAENEICKIRNGNYVINRTGVNGWYTWNNLNFHQEEDFIIEAKFQNFSGKEYGLTYAQKDFNNCYHFNFNDTQFKIFEFREGNYKVIKDYTSSPHINKGGNNNIKLECFKTKISYYINGHKVHEDSFKDGMGPCVGFNVWDNTNIEVDYIRVMQKVNALTSLANVHIERLPDEINTENAELLPVISPDENTLYYIGRNYPASSTLGQDDVFYAEKDENGKWMNGKNIGSPINNSDANNIASVTPDGNTLLLSNAYNKNGEMSGGMSFTQRTKDGWSFPVPLNIDNFYYRERVCEYFLSNDRKVILMAIIRDDSHEKKDIYFSTKKSNGDWTEPKNLGKIINTEFGIEGSPFLAADGVSLYFSSNGHLGYGGIDVFVSKRLDDTWTNWSKPINLGKKVNSSGNEWSYTIPASGKYAYFVKFLDDKNSDIFRLTFTEEMKPEPVVLIKGSVFDAKTNKPLEATIFYEQLEENVNVGTATSNPENGKYKIVLPYGKHYGYRAEAKGYISVSENMDLSQKSAYEEVVKNLYLMPLEVGQKMALNNVFFDRGKPTLLPTSYSELDHLVKVLSDNPAMQIELHGHTDNVGNQEINLKLSEQRVQTVKKYLTNKGINSKRIEGKGFGGLQPVAPNDSEENKKKNRRVEFVIIKN